MGHKRKLEFVTPSRRYEIEIGDSLLELSGRWAKKCLGAAAKRVVVVSNLTVYALYGETVTTSLTASGFVVSHWLMKDGERFKTLASAEKLLEFLSHENIQRTDAIIALGGGVVGDLAGFTSAIYLRGIEYFQIPTTLLAMIDSSVGGKTGVNSAFGKNLIGAFHQPKGVLIDIATLETLPQRELTAGFCEMIKHAAISGTALLKKTDELLRKLEFDQNTEFQISNFRSEIAELIAANIAFKTKIVANDERENINKTSPKSRKILNFGHTLGHALEKVTNYRYLKHGEAVGYGILFAAELSKTLDLCGEKDVKLLNDVLHRVGPLPRLANIDEQEVFEAFRSDKKNVAGSLQMILLKGIGKPVIISANEIPHSAIRKVLKRFLQKWS
jgi:3-dehydroquinate synthase